MKDNLLYKRCCKLEKENEELKEKIKKAIEYGKELRLFDNESLEFEIGTNFINILQGSDRDEK